MLFLSLFALFVFSPLTEEVTLNKEDEKYLTTVIKDFIADPRNSKYNAIIEPPMPTESSGKELYFLPRILLWCPILQFGIQIRCPSHQTVLQPRAWTDRLVHVGVRNPRLVFDLHENILLVQRFYCCNHNHKFLSGSFEIMQHLPNSITYHFQARVFHRSAATYDMIDMINEWVLHGMNFFQISECISGINYRKFRRRLALCNAHGNDDADDDFPQRSMYSFPSSDKLMQIFLDEFNRNQQHYAANMSAKVAEVYIAADHTFRVSKNVGLFRECDKKYMKQFENLFILLNEKEEVIAWRLTSTTSHEQIRDLLVDVHERLRRHNKEIEYIIVDKCCGPGGEDVLYKSVFGDSIPVKLDLFHAVQRVARQLPAKTSPVALQFSKEFGLIFRKAGDENNVRKNDTADKQTIEENLHAFLDKWTQYINGQSQQIKENIYDEIRKLSHHINKGCLSGLRPGSGTESNERLHKMLNSSILSNISTIGPELLQALLVVIFFHYNATKKGLKHKCNTKVPLCRPVAPGHNALPDKLSAHDMCMHFLQQTKVVEKDIPDSTAQPNTDKEDFDTSAMSKAVRKQALSMYKMLTNIKETCEKRSINIFDLPMLAWLALSSFGLEIDAVPKDGDCAFRLACFNYNKVLKLLTDLSDVVVEQFAKPGVWAHNIGDLVMKVCADILKIGIFVIPASQDTDIIPFLPKDVLTDVPMFLAYASSHYDSTKEIPKVSSGSNADESVACCCGKNSRSGESCINALWYKTRCKCYANAKRCTILCKCRNCGNKAPIEEVQSLSETICACGRNPSGREAALSSCSDNEGRRKSKCPCKNNNQACKEYCNCYNCGNLFGKKPAKMHDSTMKKKRKRADHPVYHRDRGSQFLLHGNVAEKDGCWSEFETVVLTVCMQFLQAYHIPETVEKVMALFNATATLEHEVPLRKKSCQQVAGKLRYLKERMNVYTKTQ
eukprot:gene2581-2980_t